PADSSIIGYRACCSSEHATRTSGSTSRGRSTERSPPSGRTRARSAGAGALPNVCAGGERTPDRPGTCLPRRRFATSSSPRSADRRDDLIEPRPVNQPALAAFTEPHEVLPLGDPQKTVDLPLQLGGSLVQAQPRGALALSARAADGVDDGRPVPVR